MIALAQYKDFSALGRNGEPRPSDNYANDHASMTSISNHSTTTPQHTSSTQTEKVLSASTKPAYGQTVNTTNSIALFSHLDSKCTSSTPHTTKHMVNPVKASVNTSWLGILRVFPGMNRRNGNKPLLNFVSSHTIIDLGGI